MHLLLFDWLTEMTRRERRGLPRRVHMRRSCAEFLEASGSFGAVSRKEVRILRNSGGGGDAAASGEVTPETNRRRRVYKVSRSPMLLISTERRWSSEILLVASEFVVIVYLLFQWCHVRPHLKKRNGGGPVRLPG